MLTDMQTNNLFPVKAVIPPELSTWLTQNTRPQTDILQELTGDASLELLEQQWINTNLWEKTVLGLPDKQVFRREIIMRSHDKPCWYARTIIPHSCFQQDSSFFEQLYTKQLTLLLFNQTAVMRTHFCHYSITEACQEYYWAKKQGVSLMNSSVVRASTYTFHNTAQFYLIEILLPDLLRLSPCP